MPALASPESQLPEFWIVRLVERCERPGGRVLRRVGVAELDHVGPVACGERRFELGLVVAPGLVLHLDVDAGVLLPEGLVRRGDRLGPVALGVAHQPDGDVAGLTRLRLSDSRAGRRRHRKRDQHDEPRRCCKSYFHCDPPRSRTPDWSVPIRHSRRLAHRTGKVKIWLRCRKSAEIDRLHASKWY